MAGEYRIYGNYRETLLSGAGSVNLYGFYRSALIAPPSSARVYGITRETLHTGPVNAEVRVNHVVVEVLRSVSLSTATGRRRQILNV